jgi:hypothetical protein
MDEFDAICREIRDHLGADLLNVKSSLDRWREVRVSIPKEDTYNKILSGVVPLPFTWKDAGPEEWAEDRFSASLHAYGVGKFEGGKESVEWKEITGRARTETNIGGMFRLWEYLMIVRSCDDDFQNNPFIRMLKYYHDSVWGREEGFFQHTNGDIMDIRFNAMDPLRFHLLIIMSSMHTAWSWADLDSGIPGVKMFEVMKDVCIYMFSDPYYATQELKGFVGFRSNFLTLSRAGKIVSWYSEDLSDYDLTPLDDRAETQYAVARPLLVSELEKMKELGLTHFARWYRYLLGAPVNEDTCLMLMWADFIEGAVGYQRSLSDAVVQAAMDKPKRLIDIFDPAKSRAILDEEYPEFADTTEMFFKTTETEVWTSSQIREKSYDPLGFWFDEKEGDIAILPPKEEVDDDQVEKWEEEYAKGAIVTEWPGFLINDKLSGIVMASSGTGKTTFAKKNKRYVDIDDFIDSDKLTSLRKEAMVTGDWEAHNDALARQVFPRIMALDDGHVLLTHGDDLIKRWGLTIPAYSILLPMAVMRKNWASRGETILVDLAQLNYDHVRSLDYPTLKSWNDLKDDLFPVKGSRKANGFVDANGEGSWVKKEIVDVPMGRFIREVTIETFEGIMRKGSRTRGDFLPTFDEHRKNIFKSLTSRSSGYKVEIVGELQGKTIKLNATDKTMNYLANPSLYFNKNMVMREMTIEHPGSIFFRDVPARKRRVVLGVPMATYFVEALVAPMILQYQGDKPYFSLFKDAGRVLADHSFMIYASARADIIGEGRDFSAYDQTENYENVRRFIVDGMRAALRGKDHDGFGEWSSITEALVAIWKKTSHAIFKGGDSIVELNMVLSGEFMTILINNIVNRAFLLSLRYAEEQSSDPGVRGFLSKTEPIYTQDFAMGDDASEHKRVFGKITPPEWKAHLRFLQYWSDFCFMIIKAEKTEMSEITLTYLKKRATFGRLLPRVMQKQQISSERVKVKDDPISAMHDLGAELSESVARGWNHDYIVRWQTFTMIMLTHYKYSDEYATDFKAGFVRDEKDKFSHAVIPFTAFFAAQDMGGSGLLPWTPVGSNTSVAWPHLFDEAWRFECLASGFIVEDVFSGQVKDFADSVIKAGTLNEGMKAIDESLNQNRRKQASVARDNLRTRGITVGSAAYDQTPTRLVRRTIQDHEKVRAFAIARRNSAGRKIDERQAELDSITIDPKVWKAYVSQDDCDFLRLSQPVSTVAFIRREVFDRYTDIRSIVGRTGRDIVVIDVDKDKARPAAEIIGIVRKDTPRTVLPDLVSKRMGWSLVFRTRKSGALLPKIPEPFDLPIGGATQWGRFREAARYLGISASPETFKLQTSRVISKLMRDPNFPKDWTEEAILAILSSSALTAFQDKIEFLVAMGASRDAAAGVVSQLASLASAVTFKKHASYSVADAILSYLDLSSGSTNRVIGDISVPDDNMRRIGQVIGIMVYLLASEPDYQRGISVDVGPELDSVLNVIYQWNADVLHHDRILDVGWH